MVSKDSGRDECIVREAASALVARCAPLIASRRVDISIGAARRATVVIVVGAVVVVVVGARAVPRRNSELRPGLSTFAPPLSLSSGVPRSPRR